MPVLKRALIIDITTSTNKNKLRINRERRNSRDTDLVFPHRNVSSSQPYVSREQPVFAQARLRYAHPL
jgi:hypothetical protein